jgi:hypothetical protein
MHLVKTSSLATQDVTPSSHPALVYVEKKSTKLAFIFRDDAHSCQGDIVCRFLHFECMRLRRMVAVWVVEEDGPS